jgi:hypothetical protein
MISSGMVQPYLTSFCFTVCLLNVVKIDVGGVFKKKKVLFFDSGS